MLARREVFSAGRSEKDNVYFFDHVWFSKKNDRAVRLHVELLIIYVLKTHCNLVTHKKVDHAEHIQDNAFYRTRK